MIQQVQRVGKGIIQDFVEQQLGALSLAQEQANQLLAQKDQQIASLQAQLKQVQSELSLAKDLLANYQGVKVGPVVSALDEGMDGPYPPLTPP